MKPLRESLKEIEEPKEEKPKEEKPKESAPTKTDEEDPKDRLADVLERFDQCEETIEKQNTQLTNVLPVEEKYHYSNTKVSPWLSDAEKKLDDLKEASKTPHPTSELPASIKDFENQVKKAEPTRDELNENATSLLEECTQNDVKRDVPYVIDEVQQTNERWDKLVADLDTVKKDTNQLKALVEDLEKAREPVEECIEAVEQTLEEETPLDLDDIDALKTYKDNLDTIAEKMLADQPKLKKADKKCDELADHLTDREIDPTDHKEKEDDLDKKWSDTADKLDKKRADLNENLKHLDQFVDAVDDLDNRVNVTLATVANLDKPSSDAEEIQKQLDEIDAVQEQITKQKADLANTENIADWLRDENKDNPQFCANVNNKLSKVEQPLESLRSLLADKKKRLRDALAANQDFNASLEDLLAEMDKLDAKKSKLQPLSVDWPTLKTCEEDQKVFEQDIEVLKPLHEKVVEAGKKILEEGGENKDLEKKLKDVEDRFDDNVKSCTDRREKLDKIKPLSEEFFEKEDDMTDWLEDEEKLMDDFVVAPLTVDDVKQAEEKLEKLGADITEKQPVYEDTIKASEELLDEAAKSEITEDVPETAEKTKDVTDRWEKLKKDLDSKKELCDKYDKLIDNLNKAKEPVQDALNQFGDAIEKRPEFGVDLKKANEELERAKDLLNKMDEQEPQFDDLKKANQDLVALIDDNEGDSTPIKDTADKIDGKAKKLHNKLAQNKDNLEDTCRVLDHFVGIGDDVEKWCDKATEDLKEIGPIKKKPEEAKKQIQKLEVNDYVYFQKKKIEI